MVNSNSDTSVRVSRREAKFEELLNAAARVFAEKGFQDTTIQDVARELDMTGAAIYYYVESKERLLYEVWKRAGEKLQSGIDGVCEIGGTPEEKLHGVFRTHLKVLMENRSIFEVLILQRSRLPEFGREDLIEDERKYTASIGEVIASIPDERMRLKDRTILALGVIAMLNGVIRWYSPGDRLDLDAIADIYYEMFCHGALVRD